MKDTKLKLLFLTIFTLCVIALTSLRHHVYAWTNTDIPVQTATFGGFEGNGDFNGPTDIKRDANGNIYVVSQTGSKVQKFDSNGNYISSFGSYGTGDGQFGLIMFGLAIDTQGNIIVTDWANTRVEKFDANGNFITKWGTRGSGDGQFSSPYGVITDAANNIYVTDYGNSRVEKFDSSGNFLLKWGTNGTADGQLRYPSGIAIDSNGNIYVSDLFNNRVQKFDSSGNFLMKFGTLGSADGQFKYPRGLAIDAVGNIYVADGSNNRIQKFDASGNYISQFGTVGEGDGQYNVPYSLILNNDGTMYVTDNGNMRVAHVAAAGMVLGYLGNYSQGKIYWIRPYGMAMDANDNIYIASYGQQRVVEFNKDGNYIRSIGSSSPGIPGAGDGQFNYPYDLTLDAQGNIWVADVFNNRIQKFNANGDFVAKYGSTGSADGQFSYPSGIVFDTSGNFYVCDSGNNRVQKFSANGTFISKFGSTGTADGQFKFNNNGRIYIDASGNIWLTDWGNSRIQKFDANGNFLLKFGSAGTGDGQFYSGGGPHELVVDADGNIYAADLYNNRIEKFDSNGNFLMKFGTTGYDKAQFYYLSALAFDSQGNLYAAEENNHRIQRFTFDKTAPTATTNALISNVTNQSSVTISGTATDALSPITTVEYQLDSTSGSWSACSAHDTRFDNKSENYDCLLSGLTEGSHTLYVRSTDSYTNTSTAVSYQFLLDTSIPTGTLQINNGAQYTNNKVVNLSSTVSDAQTDITSVIFSEDAAFNGAAWQSYSATKTFTLTNTQGQHTVYMKARDAAGNESGLISASIVLDTVAPPVSIASIGLIDNVPDKATLFYYFISQTARIKGVTEKSSKVNFVYDNHTYTTDADANGKYSIEIPDLPKQLVTITYFATDLAGNTSGKKTLKLMIGIENFPQNSQSAMSGSQEVQPSVTPIVSPAVPTPTTSSDQQLQTVDVVDQSGKLLTNTTVIINDQKYISDTNGKIYLENTLSSSAQLAAQIRNIETSAVLSNGKIVVTVPEQKEVKRQTNYWLWLIISSLIAVLYYVYHTSKKQK